MIFPYHPDYGYTNEFRVKVLRHAARYSVANASRKYKVSKTSIYSWRKAAA